jgi:hypothetical protein
MFCIYFEDALDGSVRLDQVFTTPKLLHTTAHAMKSY